MYDDDDDDDDIFKVMGAKGKVGDIISFKNAISGAGNRLTVYRQIPLCRLLSRPFDFKISHV